jgi:hypothetical protein
MPKMQESLTKRSAKLHAGGESTPPDWPKSLPWPIPSDFDFAGVSAGEVFQAYDCVIMNDPDVLTEEIE